MGLQGPSARITGTMGSLPPKSSAGRLSQTAADPSRRVVARTETANPG